MPCICDAQNKPGNNLIHDDHCIQHNQQLLDQELRDKHRWENQDRPCTGPGYSHPPHGKCPGYSHDRT